MWSSPTPKMSELELHRRIRSHKLYADATARQAHKQLMQQQRLEEMDLKRRVVFLPDEKRSEAHHRMYREGCVRMAGFALSRLRMNERAEQARVFKATVLPKVGGGEPRGARTPLALPRSAPASPKSPPLVPSLTVSSSALDDIITRQSKEALQQREANRQDLVQRLEAEKTFTGPLPIFARVSPEKAEETVERLRNDAAARSERAQRIAREQEAKATAPDWAAEEKEYNQGRWPHAPPRKLAKRPELPGSPRSKRYK